MNAYQFFAITVLVYASGFLLLKFLYEVFKESEAAKRKAMTLCPDARIVLSNMYNEATWLCRLIARVDSYANYCEAEDAVHTFSQGYSDCPDIEGVTKDLNGLLAEARSLVHKIDTVQPLDLRYSPE